MAKNKKKTKKPEKKVGKTAMVLAAVATLLVASGITGYKLVKTKNYGAIQDNLHKVARVIDGDTFEVEGDRKGETITVRILNISAPDKGECYYSESKKALKDLIDDREVELRKDISGVDDFNRLLRHVILPSQTEKDDNVLVGQHMVKKGYARSLPSYPNVLYKTYLVRFDTSAQNNKVGAWGACETLPKDFQVAQISDVQPEDKNCVIKGNVSETGAGKVYFLPECPSYSQVKIDLNQGEAYFCTEKKARAAGFEKSKSCENLFGSEGKN
jgi:endonuclease YncB( thermonuclease family)